MGTDGGSPFFFNMFSFWLSFRVTGQQSISIMVDFILYSQSQPTRTDRVKSVDRFHNGKGEHAICIDLKVLAAPKAAGRGGLKLDVSKPIWIRSEEHGWPSLSI